MTKTREDGKEGAGGSYAFVCVPQTVGYIMASTTTLKSPRQRTPQKVFLKVLAELCFCVTFDEMSKGCTVMYDVSQVLLRP